MSDRDELRQQIIDKAVVHGKVILSSGKEADYYVDLRRVTLDSEAAPIIGRVMLELTKDLEFDAVGGLTLGADPVATAMLHAAAAQVTSPAAVPGADLRAFNETFVFLAIVTALSLLAAWKMGEPQTPPPKA